MNTILITFSNPTFARPSVRDKYDLLLGMDATLQLAVNDRPIYSEPMFPVVELRGELARWLPEAETDFEFDSMESDEPGLVWFRRQPSGRWRVGSIHQDDIALAEIARPEIVRACESYIKAVDSWVQQNLGLNVQNILGADDA